MTFKRIKKFFTYAAATLLIAVVMLSAVGCGDKYTIFAPPESTLSAADVFALEQYSADELSDVRATLRADTMYVTERGIARPTPEILGDDYSLVYDRETNSVSSRYEKVTGENTASISFKNYPYPGGAGNNNDANGYYKNTYAEQAYDALGVSVNATDEEKAAARERYYYFYKYMLMSQGYNLAIEAQTRSQNGTLTQEWLKKHPSADLQYGEVKGKNNAVEKVIILDTLYRAYHATGLYLPAGEAVTVKVEGLKKGESISIFIGLNNSLAWRGGGYNTAEASAKLDEMSGGSALPLTGASSEAFFTRTDALAAGGYFFDENVSAASFIQGQWNRQNNRAPWITANFMFSQDGEYTIGTPFGGIMHIAPRNCYSPVKTTIRGAVETPHYILGVTTPEYYEKYLMSEETAPGVYSVIDTENGQLVGLAAYMRKNTKPEEVEKLAYLWHSFFAVNESFTGGSYNRANLVQFDQHVPAGAAVALGGYVYACPTSWFDSATNYRALLQSGTWGILHEIGHNHGSAYGSVWGMGGGQEGEVRNNALTCLAYLKFCDIGTMINENGAVPAEHGFVAHPYSSLMNTINIKNNSTATDFNDFGYFDALNIYTNIMHSFGVDKFYELLRTYKDDPSFNPSVGGQTVGNKRSDFAYRLSKVYGMNFRPYIDGIFKGGTQDFHYSAEQLSYMNSLPTYHPIACLYAGGIDGVKTGGDHRIGYGDEKIFDLKGKTITTADGFEIIKVHDPEHGKITDMGEGKYKYSFDKKYSGNTDSFSFDVRLSDGVCHRLTVYLRYMFSGAQISDYGAVATADLSAEAAALESKTPTQVFVSQSAGVAGFSNAAENKYEMRTATFWYRAPADGEFSFSATADDKSILYFGESFDSLEAKSVVETYTGSYNDSHSFTVTLQKDKYYAFKIVNLNTGGAGGAMLGVKYGGAAAYSTVPASQIKTGSLSDPYKFEDYVYEPRFIASKKDNALAATMNSDKSEWRVLEAPDDIQGGRYVIEQMTDPDTGEPNGTIETDKRTWLIDGNTGTIFHTVWTPNPTPATDQNPDVFVIDTQNVQSFNYFKITAPNRSDYCIKRYQLLISSDNEQYTEVASGAADNPLKYTGGAAEISFPQVHGRYWKLIVKETSAANSNYTVISEIDAGVKSSAQMVYPSTSGKYYQTKAWTAVKAGDGETRRSGLMWAEKKNSKLVIKIKSSSISLYSDKGEGYGSAKIKLDGKLMDTVSLQSDTPQSRCLIFNEEGLNEKEEHTVEIITTSNLPFNLDFIGASYNSVLVNAPNIYKERALTISLVVFVLLFVIAVAALCVIFFVPSMREKLFGSDKHGKKSSSDKKQRSTDDKRTEAVVASARESSVSKESAAQTRARTTPQTAARPTGAAAQRTTAQTAARPTTATQRTTAQTAARPTTATQRTTTQTAAARTPSTGAAQTAAKPTSTATQRTTAQNANARAQSATPVKPTPTSAKTGSQTATTRQNTPPDKDKK